MKHILNNNKENYDIDKGINDNIIEVYKFLKPAKTNRKFFASNFCFLNNASIKKNYRIAYFINISSLIIYYLCLKGCPYSIAVCVEDNWQRLYKIEASCIIGIGLILSLEYTFIIINLNGIRHIIYNTISYAIIFNYFGNGNTFSNHGEINKYVFVSAFLLFFILFLIIGFLIKLTLKFKYAKKMMIVINFIITIVILMKILSFFKKGDCSNWVKGINGTNIDNSEIYDSCFMKVPKSCKINIYLNYLDNSKALLPDCKLDKTKFNEYKVFISSLKIPRKYKKKSKMKHFGYPITTGHDYDMKIIKNSRKLRKKVYKNIIPMDIFAKLKKKHRNLKKPEVELIFDKNNIGTIFINANKINIKKSNGKVYDKSINMYKNKYKIN